MKLLLFLFSALYLADYALTLTAMERTGFHEMNPLAPYWNTGDYRTALYVKLAGLAVILPSAVALHRAHPALYRQFILSATLLFLAVDGLSFSQLFS